MTTFLRQSETYLERIKTRKRKPVKATSLATFASLIRAATPVLGKRQLEDIHSGTLKNLAAVLCDEKYSPNSIQSILTLVKQIIASDIDETTGDPKHPRKWNRDFIDAPPAESKKVHVPTVEEIDAALASSPSPLWQFMCTQLATGLRKGELCALTVADFDSHIGLLHVSRTLSRYGETTTKTKSGERDVDIVPEIVEMLIAMLAGRTTGRLFDVSLDQIRYAYERVAIKSHSFRHFRYTLLQKHKIHPAIHAYWIGHSAKGMSTIYGHIEQDIELRQRLVREVGLGFRLPKSVATPIPEPVPESQMAVSA
jgi:integrase